ncbi:MAG TPA: WD40 repeat domain-containing protein [Opitutaceae bacterium]|nr:WD40 repeat domain-containing protein [Opitutaceae bacterium]
MNLSKHWAGQLDDYAIDLAWSPDGALLAAASAAGPIVLFAAADGARRHELPGHENGANALAWSPEGAARLASGGQDGAVKFWDGATGQHTATAALGAGWVEHLAWGPAVAAACGRKLALLGPDGALRHTLPDAPKTFTALAWRPSAPLLAAAYFGGVRLIEAGTGALKKELPYNNGIQALTWSPEGRWLVSGNQDPSVHLWVPDEDLELQMSGYETKVKHLAFDRSGRWLATGGGRDACVWDCAGAGPEGRAPAMFPHDAPVSALAFQHRHGLLATAAADGTVMLWSPDRRQPLRATVKMTQPPTKLAWSQDDGQLALGSAQGAVYVLKCENG